MKMITKTLLAIIIVSIGVSTVIAVSRLGVGGVVVALFGVALCLVAYHIAER